MKKRLTTTEVAELLDVSEATVKRWADAGVFRFDKTTGGHRRFEIDAISRFQRERLQTPWTEPKETRKLRHKGERKELLDGSAFSEYLLGAKVQEAGLALVDAYLRGHGLVKLFDTVVTDAMHSIGEMWFRGEITISDEHLATQTVLGAIAQLRNAVGPIDSLGLKAICCGIESDLHELPTHLATSALENRGWKATNLGPNTPVYSVCELITTRGRNDFKGTDLICIAARMIRDLERAAREIATLRQISDRIGARIILGGEGFRDPVIRQKCPADVHATSFADLEKLAAMVEAEKHQAQ